MFSFENSIKTHIFIHLILKNNFDFYGSLSFQKQFTLTLVFSFNQAKFLFLKPMNFTIDKRHFKSLNNGIN